MVNKHLFLFGSGPPFTPGMAERFSGIIMKRKGPVSILFIEREGMDWREYMPVFTQPLKDKGVHSFNCLPLLSTSVREICESIKQSAGILIGGGDTNLYADYIADTEVAGAIKAKYEIGVPIAGFSAGALISPDRCVISPNDNTEGVLQHRMGMGLIQGVLLAVHFSQWNDEPHLKNAVRTFPNRLNFGIDEKTAIYLRDGEYIDAEGGGVYSIENGLLKRIN
ncbi:Type 1 glutamine amidotransferase-like domain-containing protein [Virgibacillus ihumii]|uniref:Type 1 glutamine amidotransferase-like domain-containing protein n=1 Tax=Virgibacillus ihumii TaxID=2686091 RepID=UPI00157CF135|nr:Type 1 glutamine amidotransferase-like domain-containing protein [Virgibacillus ihumii]